MLFTFDFSSFCASIQPKMAVKSSSLMRKYLCPLVFQQVSKAVLQVLSVDLADVDGFAGTTDHWNSKAGEAYQSLTIHYIDKDFKLKKVMKFS